MRTISALLVWCVLSSPAVAQNASPGFVFPNDAAGWRLVEPPSIYVGDDLFRMIDGGAALYQEYGFDRAASAHYEDSAGHSIEAEMYSMSDCAASDGIFGITAAAGGEKGSLGDECELGEYFLVFRKGPHVVTVSGQNSDRPTMDGVKGVGRAIEKCIEARACGPVVSWQFIPLVTAGTRPVFVRGVIGVGNFYMFSARNVFNVHEGVTGQRDSTRFFVFRYADPKETKKCFLASAELLQAEPKYSAFSFGQTDAAHPQRFECNDRDGNLLSARLLSRFIIVVIGRSRDRVKELDVDVGKNLAPASVIYHADQ